MPPSRPDGGRVRSSTQSSPRSATKAAPRRSTPSAFGALRGSVSCTPAARARQAPSHGQMAQAGRFGVQIVAPRSIRACAKSPGRSAGTSASARSRISGLCLRQRRLDEEQPRNHALDIAVDRGGGAIKRDRRDRRRRVGADAGQAAQARLGVGEASAVALGERPGAGMEVAGARVIAEPGPGLHHLFDRRLGEPCDRREALQEALVEGLHGRNRRLLQHDLRQPDAIGIGRRAGLGAPGQVAAVPVVPGEKLARFGL